MRLRAGEALTRLECHDHGVLCTQHPTRGLDAVPVVFALDGDLLGVPVDLVKPKSSTRLQREVNLEHDPRAVLLIEQWDRDDWSQLWWVRAHLTSLGADTTSDQQEGLAARLSQKYPAYRDRPFARVLVLRLTEISGWSAASTPT